MAPPSASTEPADDEHQEKEEQERLQCRWEVALAWTRALELNFAWNILKLHASLFRDAVDEARAAFGFAPATPLEDGLRRTWAWFDSQRTDQPVEPARS